jgi:nicotinamidase-related amidase
MGMLGSSYPDGVFGTRSELSGPMAQAMVIDMLEGFTRIGPRASPRVDALVPRQAECLRALPAESSVVFLADEHDQDDVEFRRFPPHCLRGAKEVESRPELLAAVREAEVDVQNRPGRG